MESLRSNSSNHWPLDVRVDSGRGKCQRPHRPMRDVKRCPYARRGSSDDARQGVGERVSRAFMTITSVILVAANVSLAMTMLCAGMGGLSGDTTYLIRRRGLFLRSLLSMSALQPLFALWLCFAYDLRPAAMLALLAMAVSPMPPILPTGVLKVRGNRAFEVSLSYFTAILSIVLIPASLWLF